MKKLIFLSVMLYVNVLLFSQVSINTVGNVGIGMTPSSSHRLNVTGSVLFNNNFTTSGNVGIGTTPTSYKLHVNGSFYVGNNLATFGQGLVVDPFGSGASIYIDGSVGQYTAEAVIYPNINNTNLIGKSNKAFKSMYCYNYYDLNSDLTQKENIKDLTNALDLILQLRGIRFDLKKEIAYNDTLIKDPKIKEKLELERKNKIGFIGQEMINILPEAVKYDDSTNIYAIDYTRVIPVLVEAIKEQQKQIEQLSNKNGFKNSDLASDNLYNKNAWLGSCKPNPFSHQTSIEYQIPDNISKAVFYIYDINGSQIRNMQIDYRGKGSIIINSSELQPGIYHYSLFSDGQLVGIEKMILTE